MKNIIIAILIIASVGVVVYFISDGNFSRNSSNFGSVNYDKAYRDMMAMFSENPSLTIQESQSMLKETGMGMSSKDYFSLSKSQKLIKILSLDMIKNKYKEYNIDFNNLKRALGE